MALTYGFYNSLNGDRKYDAVQMSQIFDGIINDGIFMSIGDKLMVTANEGMTVKVGTGRAWFNGTWTCNDAPYILTLEPSNMLLKRIDAVVLEINTSDDVRENSLKIITGTPSSEPVKPDLIRTDKVNQYPLAYISVGIGEIEILPDDIENAVGFDPCPFVTGILETIPIDDIVSGWEYEWTSWMQTMEILYNQWFDNLQTSLGEDVAGDLQLQIFELQSKIEYIGDISVNEYDYSNSLQTNLDNYVVEKVSRDKREGDIVSVRCDALYKQELWICVKGSDSLESWIFWANAKPDTSTIYVESVLEAVKWNSGVYSFEDTYPSSVYDIEICLSKRVNRTELYTFGRAGIVGDSAENRILAIDTIPDIDIPVTIKVVKK